MNPVVANLGWPSFPMSANQGWHLPEQRMKPEVPTKVGTYQSNA